MKRMAAGVALPVVVLVAFVTCKSDPITEIIVVVDTDLDIGVAIESVHFDVDDSAIGGDGETADVQFTSDGPATLGIVHQGGALGPIVVTATGMLGTTSVLSRTASVHFSEGRVMMLRLDLLSTCVGVPCSADESCMDDGICRSMDQVEMTEWTGSIDDLDASVADGDSDSDADEDVETCNPETEEVCNGVDDDCDGVIDEGFDLVIDRNNCGRCGHACPELEACVARACPSDPVAVAAGEKHSCAITSIGEVKCWGSNSHGQLGNGSPTEFPIDGVIDVIDLPGPAIDIAAGARHSCAIVVTEEPEPGSRHAWCWGDDSQGQLGEGSSEGSPGPVVVALDLRPVSITAGDEHSCMIDEMGQAHCWGNGTDGRLGNNSFYEQTSPVEVYGHYAFVWLSAGGRHTCGVSSTSEVLCWGDNDRGQLGISAGYQWIPASVSDAGLAVQVASGYEHTCALAFNGSVSCWGDNNTGQLGADIDGWTSTPTAVLASGETPLEAVWLAAGRGHTCAVQYAGNGLCWGSNELGQLGIDDDAVMTNISPAPVAELAVIVRLTAGYDHSCARDDSDTLWCWGTNIYYQVGVSARVPQFSPVRVRDF